MNKRIYIIIPIQILNMLMIIFGFYEVIQIISE